MRRFSTVPVDITKLLEPFPEMNTQIKVYDETSVEDLMAVIMEQLMAACIAHEVESRAKLMGAGAENQAAQDFLKSTSKNSCTRVEKACAKDINGRRCQRYARSY